jgi:hypothetical protein
MQVLILNTLNRHPLPATHSLSHTHTLTHTLSLSLTHTHSHTHTTGPHPTQGPWQRRQARLAASGPSRRDRHHATGHGYEAGRRGAVSIAHTLSNTHSLTHTTHACTQCACICHMHTCMFNQALKNRILISQRSRAHIHTCIRCMLYNIVKKAYHGVRLYSRTCACVEINCKACSDCPTYTQPNTHTHTHTHTLSLSQCNL